MKCEIANDLLTLYVEDLCSPETRKEVEAHLGECPECSKKLEHYRKELKNEVSNIGEADDEKKDAVSEMAEIEPMKKVKKKMKRSKWKIAVLSLVLLVMLAGIGILSFGEATNYCPGFTMIADMIKIKSACKDLAEGKPQAFADLMATRLEDRYVLRATGAFEDMDAYKAEVVKNVNKAYECYFKGKDVKVKFNDIGVVPFSERGNTDEIISYIFVDFCEGDTVLCTMEFAKVSNNYFTVYEEIKQATGDAFAPSFTDGVILYDDIIYKITMPYAAQNSYKKLKAGEKTKMGAGLTLIIEKSGDQGNEEFKQTISEKMEFLKEKGCYIKNVTYNLTEYDDESGKWIYKVSITYEDQQSGMIFVTEQNFVSHNNNLYIMDDEKAVLSSGMVVEEAVSEEVLQTVLHMFE